MLTLFISGSGVIEVQELSMLINQNLEFNPFSIVFQKIVT